ncbi:hypothetical protein ACFCT7_13530 [Fulvivirgaceae bacterium LMO-SS25]
MNFEEIKKKMEGQEMNELSVPTNIKQIEKSKLPIQKVRRSMRSEIATQLVIIVLFFTAPFMIPMDQLAKGLYLILQFVTALITLLYLAKMTWFLNKTSDISGSSKDTVVAFIYDLKLTLEVYKTAVIAGSLLLPISLLTFCLGIGKVQLNTPMSREDIFLKLISLDMSNTNLLIIICGYLFIATIIYYGTVKWADRLYGVHVKNLQTTLKDFEQ